MDKVALVTGGAQGIGRAIALAAAARAAGRSRSRTSRRPSAAGRNLPFVKCDVSRSRRCAPACAPWSSASGEAGRPGEQRRDRDPHTGPVEKLALREWNRRIGVNLGAFLMAKHAAPHLRRARGAIVNIASTRALQSEPDTEPYAAAKAGLVGLTHALAISLGPEVRVNCVSPGWIRAPAGAREDHASTRSAASGATRTSPARRLPAFGRRGLRHRAELRHRRRHDAQDDLCVETFQTSMVASPSSRPMLTTSVAVVRKMLEAVAGSKPKRFSVSG